MELTDLEKRTQSYAVECCTLHFRLLQQVSSDVLMRLVENERAWLEYDANDMPDLAVTIASRLLMAINEETRDHESEWREHYIQRYRALNVGWDPNTFSGETWLKKAMKQVNEKANEE